MILTHIPLWLDESWKLISFFLIQYALGKRGSFPYGLLIGFSLVKVAILVALADILQTIILLNLMEYSLNRVSLFRGLKNFLEKRQEKRRQRQWLMKLSNLGNLGLLMISSLPQGGGALTGSLVAISLRARKLPAILSISFGCIISSFIFYEIFTGILKLPW